MQDISCVTDSSYRSIESFSVVGSVIIGNGTTSVTSEGINSLMQTVKTATRRRILRGPE